VSSVPSVLAMIMLASGPENDINFNPVANDAALAMIMLAQGIAGDVDAKDVEAGERADVEEGELDIAMAVQGLANMGLHLELPAWANPELAPVWGELPPIVPTVPTVPSVEC
jgi:hypothetical protein